MAKYSISEFEEAHRSLGSTLGKCEKAILKLKEGSAQHTLMIRRIKSFQIALALIQRELQSERSG